MNLGHCRLSHNSYIQSVLFDKTIWNKRLAKNWLEHHNMKSNKVDESGRFYRYRQHNPMCFERFITKKTSKGIEYIIGFTH